jgi:hypothetical protein
MRLLLVFLFTLTGAGAAFAQSDFLSTQPKPIIKANKGKWYGVDKANPLTKGKSSAELEILNLVQSGEIPLYVDPTAWGTHVPTTVPQAINYLKSHTTAKDVKWVKVDPILLGTAHPENAEDALMVALQRIRDLEGRVKALEP